jgi:hypothetical protein
MDSINHSLFQLYHRLLLTDLHKHAILMQKFASSTVVSQFSLAALQMKEYKRPDQDY